MAKELCHVKVSEQNKRNVIIIDLGTFSSQWLFS